MKEILIINGSGGVGKDTFVSYLGQYAKVYHTSIVERVKKVARVLGWNGDKSEKDRKFLSDLKILVDEYNNSNFKAMEELMQSFKEGIIDADLLCIDMREKDQIEIAKEKYGAKTVLVTRDQIKHITSNVADSGVFQIEYDYVIENNGNLKHLEKLACNFVEDLKEPHGCWAKAIYISHPYGGKEENKKFVESKIKELSTIFPHYLFVSAIHAFGHQYKYLPYEKGLNECLWLLSTCDEMWTFADKQSFLESKGCMREYEFCKDNDIPFKYIN